MKKPTLNGLRFGRRRPNAVIIGADDDNQRLTRPARDFIAPHDALYLDRCPHVCPQRRERGQVRQVFIAQWQMQGQINIAVQPEFWKTSRPGFPRLAFGRDLHIANRL